MSDRCAFDLCDGDGLLYDADTNKLISPTLPWRQLEAQFETAFPQNVDLIAIVIDAKDAPKQ